MFQNSPDIKKALFFDDGLAWATGETLEIAMEKMQKALDTISEWGPKLGIKFSTTKTKYMIFTKREVKLQRGNDQPNLSLNFYGESIVRVFHYKYLGMTFDPTLTWTKHINRLVSICKKPLNILKYVENKNWGLTASHSEIYFWPQSKPKLITEISFTDPLPKVTWNQ